MLSALVTVLAQDVAPVVQGAFERPAIDWHAISPELVILSVGALITLLDILFLDKIRPLIPALTGIGLLATMVPIITLAADDTGDRFMWGGAYAVDDLSLVLKALFVLAGYVVVLLSTNYIAEGDYHEAEFYQLLLSSIMGMVVMASARDLVTIFVALELLSIPAYLMAAWRKADPKSNEAGLKYLLMGVFASGIMLYGMSLVYGVAGSTKLSDIGAVVGGSVDTEPIITLGIVFVLVGFAFKVSAVPFHTWAPDTYEGAPTPLTAFLAVSSKTAGFVGLIQLIFIGFLGRSDVIEPMMWALAAATMTVGNLIALRQTNIIRMLAYSGVAQGGFMLAPLAVVGDVPDTALSAVVTYLAIYAAMNLGAFAAVIAVARRTGSGEISSFGGLFQYAPGLTVLFTVFLFSLAGIPPLGGWFAKFRVFESLIDAGTWQASVLGVIVAVNSVIALFYYANVARQMWFLPAPDGDERTIPVPVSLAAAMVICVILTILAGVYPAAVTQFTDFSNLALGG